MLRALPLILALALPGALLVVAGEVAGADGVPLDTASRPTKADGPKIFRSEGCDVCHSVSAAGIEARGPERVQGPDLSGVGARVDAGLLAGYLRQEAAIDGKKHRKGFKGSDEELQALVDWLLEL